MTESRAGEAQSAGERWLALHDALLHGITHALSNRIATLSASAYMLEYGDISAEQAAVSLRDETERLDGLLQLMRLLPGSEDAAFEPVSLHEMLEQAVAVHAHHLDVREVPVTVEVGADLPPVWVEPHALLRSLLLLLDSARHDAFAAAGSVRLTLTTTGGEVELLVAPDVAREDTTDATTRRTLDRDAAAWYVAGANGAVRSLAHGAHVLTLPSLASARAAGR